jgi:hypothetical protein
MDFLGLRNLTDPPYVDLSVRTTSGSNPAVGVNEPARAREPLPDPSGR